RYLAPSCGHSPWFEGIRSRPGASCLGGWPAPCCKRSLTTRRTFVLYGRIDCSGRAKAGGRLEHDTGRLSPRIGGASQGAALAAEAGGLRQRAEVIRFGVVVRAVTGGRDPARLERL